MPGVHEPGINAFEALNGAGRVRISAWASTVEDDHGHRGDGPSPVPTIVVEIADDGPGIPDELKDRVFNAFFTTKAQGSGLGLAIVRKIVDAHDGRIDVAAGPGGGTRFTVTLPLSAGGEWFQ